VTGRAVPNLTTPSRPLRDGHAAPDAEDRMNDTDGPPVPPGNPRGVVATLLAACGVVAFAVTLMSTLAGILARYFSVVGFEWSFELAGIAFLWTTFLGVAYAELRGDNVAFSLVVDAAPPRARRLLGGVSALALLVVAGALLASGLAVLQRSGMVPTPLLRWPGAVSSLPLIVFAVAAVAIALARLSAFLRRSPAGEPRR
jgi:TRAP-type C4-dicarboxylate transport system permease small subunit